MMNGIAKKRFNEVNRNTKNSLQISFLLHLILWNTAVIGHEGSTVHTESSARFWPSPFQFHLTGGINAVFEYWKNPCFRFTCRGCWVFGQQDVKRYKFCCTVAQPNEIYASSLHHWNSNLHSPSHPRLLVGLQYANPSFIFAKICL